MPDLSQALSLLALPALLGAAMTDIASRRVPNACCAGVAALGIMARFAFGDLLPSVLLTSAVFAVLFGCWLRGWLGGGDVKLLVACALLVPAGAVSALAVAVALSGGVLAAVYLVGRAVHQRPLALSAAPRATFRRVCRVEGWRIRRGAPLPYACAIAAGCIFTIVAG